VVSGGVHSGAESAVAEESGRGAFDDPPVTSRVVPWIRRPACGADADTLPREPSTQISPIVGFVCMQVLGIELSAVAECHVSISDPRPWDSVRQDVHSGTRFAPVHGDRT
jgi:hypothetical protein